MMTVESWLAAAVTDAEQRGLAALKPMLETLARSMAGLRAADADLRAATRNADPSRQSSDGNKPPGTR